MKVVIIGANGTIGRRFTNLYKKRGVELYLADIQGTDDISNLDILDKDSIKSFLPEKFDLLFHFAGLSGALDSFNNYENNVNVNNIGLLNILDVVKDMEQKPTVIFPSSRLVYGTQNSEVVSVTDIPNPNTIYGCNKHACENYLKSYWNLYNIPYLIFRISIPYGEFDIRDRLYGIVNIFIKRALDKEVIKILGDGEQKRDYIAIDDMFIIINNIIEKGIINRLYNLGGVETYSIKELAQLVISYLPTNIEFTEWSEKVKKIETGSMILDSEDTYKDAEYKPIYHLNKYIGNIVKEVSNV